MSESQIGSVLFLLFILIAAAQALGYLFTRLRQPRVIGEILAGVLLGPSLLGKFLAGSSLSLNPSNEPILSFVYWLGLLLLMFVSGSETRHLFRREDRREVAWLAILGTGIPFVVALAISPWLPLDLLAGPHSPPAAMVLVLGIAVAVTSIPVIARIFHDLGILHTRFARLVLGVAVLEDIALWAVLAIATALAASGALPATQIAGHVTATLAYFAAGLAIGPVLLKRIGRARWNVLAASSPLGYMVAVLFAYAALAAAMHVTLVFAAFLAGFALVRDHELFANGIESLHKFSFGVFVPVYFAMVGYRLDLSRSFPLRVFAIFIVGACGLKLLSVALGARLAGFGPRAIVNLSAAMNARGGPGIVLASVAYDAGIINAGFYTTLVLTAVLTSQAAGAWLEHVLRKGWPLLEPELVEQPECVVPEELAA